MISMVRLFVPALFLGLVLPAWPAAAEGPNADLSSVGTVYVLPMASGMEQFIAHQVAKQGIYEVTTDPLRADAFISDFVGASFEIRVDDLLKAARDKKEKEAEDLAKKEAEKSGEAVKKPAKKPKDEEEAPEGGFQMESMASGRVGAFGRGKGNIFLVEGKTRRVLWTGFDIPKNTRAEALQKSAEKLVAQLRKEKTGKSK